MTNISLIVVTDHLIGSISFFIYYTKIFNYSFELTVAS